METIDKGQVAGVDQKEAVEQKKFVESLFEIADRLAFQKTGKHLSDVNLLNKSWEN